MTTTCAFPEGIVEKKKKIYKNHNILIIFNGNNEQR